MDEEPSDQNVRQELAEALREIAKIRTESRPRVADDLLMLFGRIAGLILVSIVVLTAALVVFRPSTDFTALATLLNTQLSLIIGAVLGYAAHPSDRET